MRCLNDLLSPDSTVLWSLPPDADVYECLLVFLFLVFLNPCGQMSNSSSSIVGITSKIRQFVDNIGFHITGDWRLKGGSVFQFPGRKLNLFVGDAAHLVCKQLTLISWILKH